MKVLEIPAAQFFEALLSKTFHFFASLGLAVFLLVSLMIVLAVGTILESLYGADTAKILVYQAPWFTLLLILLGVNVAAAALDRYPWKKKHVGFVVTHLGILMILAGSLATQKSMVDGQMVIAEGETEYRLTLPQSLLHIFSQATEEEWVLRVPEKAFPWEGKKLIFQTPGFSVFLRKIFPKARVRETLKEADQGPAALEISLHSSFADQSLTLIEEDPELGHQHLGPAVFSFSREPLKAQPEETVKEASLEFQIGESGHRLPIPEKGKWPLALPLQGTSYQVEILETFRDAIVNNQKLVERNPGVHDAQGPSRPSGRTSPSENGGGSLAGENPAIRFFLRGKDFEELHTVFSNYPDFPTIHGMKPSRTGARIFYRLPGAGPEGDSHELRFVLERKGGLHPSVREAGTAPILLYQIKDGKSVKTAEAVVGQEVPLGWMDFRFRIDKFYPHASMEKNFTPEPPSSKSESVFPAIQIEVEKNGKSKEVWLGKGSPELVKIEGDGGSALAYHFLFGEKKMPAGFRLELRDFRMKQYPGTRSPASFESDVVLTDVSMGLSKEATISMNEPLSHRGFKIYQSGYSIQEGQPEISIFSVGKDPGIPLKYLGTIVMVAGIALMYFIKRFSIHGGKVV